MKITFKCRNFLFRFNLPRSTAKKWCYFTTKCAGPNNIIKLMDAIFIFSLKLTYFMSSCATPLSLPEATHPLFNPNWPTSWGSHNFSVTLRLVQSLHDFHAPSRSFQPSPKIIDLTLSRSEVCVHFLVITSYVSNPSYDGNQLTL